MKISEAAEAILLETGNDAIMFGDVVLLHQVAHKMGWNSNGSATERRVLDAMTRSPGKFLARYTRIGNGRLVRIFRLPEISK